MKKVLILMGFLCITSFAFAQANTFLKLYPSYLGHASCVLESDSGGFILISPGIAATTDFAIKTDSMGNEIISKNYCSSKALRMTRSLDSNYVFTSSTKSLCTPGTYKKLVITKINSNLDTLWTKMYADSSLNLGGNCIRTLKDGKYIVTAYDNNNLYKLDTLGNIIWQHQLPISMRAVIEDSDSNFVICGGSGNWEITKTNSTGDSIIWLKDFGSSTGLYSFQDLIELADGNYFAGGYTDSPGFPFKYVKIDRITGDTLWSSPISTVELYSFNNGHNGNIITADRNMTLIDQAGNELWSVGFTNINFRYAIPTSDGGYIASGFYQDSTLFDIHPVLLKTDSLGNYSPTGIEELEIRNLDLKIFPNPATDYITIQYNLTSPKEISVSVFNIYGQIVYSENLQGFKNLAGLNHLQIDLKDLEQGIYFVKINAGGKEEVRKVVKL